MSVKAGSNVMEETVPSGVDHNSEPHCATQASLGK